MNCLSLDATTGRVVQLAREKEEKRAQERRRHLIYLIAAFLREQGYFNIAENLFKEAQLSRDIQVCDNIDLQTIILEYSDYYYAKYNRYPKFCKKIETTENITQNTNKKERISRIPNSKLEDSRVTVIEECNNISRNKIAQKHNNSSWNELNLGITVTPIFPTESGDRIIAQTSKSDENFTDKRVLKSINDLYPLSSELKEIAGIVSQEIVQQNLNVHWDDLKGLKNCKMLLKEVIVYPMKYPSLFNGKLNSCKGVLLYGPPGTGKTMLAKAVATECRSTFFNITSSSLISKWRGDSEKYIRVLIDLAKHYAPTIIFIDEIDWTKNLDDTSSSSEPARRFRAEFLIRLDGLLSMEYSSVILLAATNIPWNIDIALLRRLEKRIFVDLPDEASRLELLQSYVRSDLHDSSEMLTLARETVGYSCADLKLLCKEAWINQLRPIWASLETKAISVNDVQNDGLINAMNHLMLAKHNVKPIAKHMNAQYVEWNKKFGSSKK